MRSAGPSPCPWGLESRAVGTILALARCGAPSGRHDFSLEAVSSVTPDHRARWLDLAALAQERGPDLSPPSHPPGGRDLSHPDGLKNPAEHCLALAEAEEGLSGKPPPVMT